MEGVSYSRHPSVSSPDLNTRRSDAAAMHPTGLGVPVEWFVRGDRVFAVNRRRGALGRRENDELISVGIFEGVGANFVFLPYGVHTFGGNGFDRRLWCSARCPSGQTAGGEQVGHELIT